MKIAMTAFVLDEGRSGIATYVRGLLRGLSDININHHYDVLLPKGSERCLPALRSNFHLLTSPSWLSQPILNILWHNTVLPICGAARHYNVVHIPSFRRIPLIKSCPIVATIHDMAPLAVENKYDKVRTFYHREILSRLIFRCDRIMTVSQHTKKDIMRFTGYPENKIDVIYPGIDTVMFSQRGPEEARSSLRQKYNLSSSFIVYVSRIEHPGKNHINLIKAFEAFKKQESTPHQLVLAGADWRGAFQVKEYVAKSPFRSSIQFLGYVPQEDVINLYSGCDLSVFPSLYEGFGFPLLEAMSCGAKVACSNNSSLAEIGGGYVETFNPHDPVSIHKSMLKALQEKLNHRSREHAMSFSWERTARAVLKVYERYE